MPQRTFTITEKIALSILADQGVAAIWKLHEGAATVHRMGYPRSAEAILEIAEAAEEAWLSARERLRGRLADLVASPSDGPALSRPWKTA